MSDTKPVDAFELVPYNNVQWTEALQILRETSEATVVVDPGSQQTFEWTGTGAEAYHQMTQDLSEEYVLDVAIRTTPRSDAGSIWDYCLSAAYLAGDSLVARDGTEQAGHLTVCGVSAQDLSMYR